MEKELFLTEFGHLAQGPDGVKKLRDLILQLAVQGKLVEQDPNDEPASVLLERIKKERAQLISKNKIKKNKRAGIFPGSSEVYEIPSTWCLTSLYEIGSINPRNEAEDEEDAGFVPMPLISQFYGEHHSYELKKWGNIKKGYTQFADGDVGLAKITPCFENSKCCVFSNLPNGIGSGTTELHIFRDETHNVLSEYVYLFLKSPYFLEDGKQHMTGSAGQKRVPTDYFSQKPLPLPPLAEQKRIVAKVDELMALCDELEATQETNITLKRDCVASTLHHLSEASDKDEIKSNWSIAENNFGKWFDDLETVKNLRATILQLAVQGKLVEQDPNDEPASVLLEKINAKKDLLIKTGKLKKTKSLPPVTDRDVTFNIPRSWSYERLGNLTAKLGSGSTPRGGSRVYTKEGIPFLRSQNVWNDGLRLDDIAYIPEDVHQSMNNTHVFPNDILLNITGASLGRSTVFPEELVTANVSQHVTIIRMLFPEMVPFVHLGILSPLVQRLVWGRQVGMAIEGLSKKVLEQFEFPIPPLEEQKRIVAKVDELMALCDQLETQILSSQTLNQTLMASLCHHMTVN